MPGALITANASNAGTDATFVRQPVGVGLYELAWVIGLPVGRERVLVPRNDIEAGLAWRDWETGGLGSPLFLGGVLAPTTHSSRTTTPSPIAIPRNEESPGEAGIGATPVPPAAGDSSCVGMTVRGRMCGGEVMWQSVGWERFLLRRNDNEAVAVIRDEWVVGALGRFLAGSE
jgi:hypothetical protein